MYRHRFESQVQTRWVISNWILFYNQQPPHSGVEDDDAEWGLREYISRLT